MKLLLEKSRGTWRCSEAAGEQCAGDEQPRHASEDVGFYFFGGRVEEPDLLGKELCADALLHEAEFFAALGRAVRHCSSAKASENFAIDLPTHADARRFRRMFSLALPGAARAPLFELGLRFLAAALAALAGLLWSTIRYGSSRRPGPAAPICVAAHAEWTNRSRHLLGLYAAQSDVIPLILLGRPRSSLRAVEAMLRQHLPAAEFQLARPISLSAAIAAVPALVSELCRAFVQFRARGYMPPLTRAVPILYRLCLGWVHRSWWRRSGMRPNLVVYAHTGTADTSALELEQQRCGARTVHLFHGITTGHSFTGFSDVAITRCGHDADWHRRLGGYGTCISLSAPQPKVSDPTPEWALFTNYAHPTAFADESVATAMEARVLRLVAAVAERLGRRPEQVLYRPHPALSSLGDAAQQRVEQAARSAGLAFWPSQRDPHALSMFELIVTTPSTIVQDGLLAGTVPIVIDLVGVDPDSVYGAYPFRARSEAELVAIARAVRANRQEAFERAWNAVGPGTTVGLRQIVEQVGAIG